MGEGSPGDPPVTVGGTWLSPTAQCQFLCPPLAQQGHKVRVPQKETHTYTHVLRPQTDGGPPREQHIPQIPSSCRADELAPAQTQLLQPSPRLADPVTNQPDNY